MSEIHIPVQDADPEYDPPEALLRDREAPQAPEECCVVVHCWRARDKWDCDNVSVKPILDGLVRAGVLKDDSQRQVKAYIVLPYRCDHQSEEKTIVELIHAEAVVMFRI